MALLCLKTAYMASRAIFKRPMRGRPDIFHESAISKNGTGFLNWPFRKMARAAGLEPTTCGFGDRRSTN
jgi:hypothetical protein